MFPCFLSCKTDRRTANSFFSLSFVILISASICLAQEIPDKIRGYKVHRAEVSVNEVDSDDKFAVNAVFGKPSVDSIGLSGLELIFDTTMTISGKSGEVDFITFDDFSVNDVPVTIEEYDRSFEFRKGESVTLEDPVRIRISALQSLRAAYKEVSGSKDKWRVKGRVFVFGKFRKFGFKFKRVVPVDVDFLIDNPVK